MKLKRTYGLVCQQCNNFFRTTRRFTALCPECSKKEKGGNT